MSTAEISPSPQPNPDILVSLAEQLRRTTRPLEQALESNEAFARLLAEHGWRVEPSGLMIDEIRAAIGIAADLQAATEIVADLVASRQYPDASKTAELISRLRTVLTRLRTLSDVAAPASIPDHAWRTLADELPETLVCRYLEVFHPSVYGVLLAMGAVEETIVPSDGSPSRVDYVRRTLRWQGLTDAVADPAGAVRARYGWGEPGFDHARLLRVLRRCLELGGLPVEEAVPAPARLDRFYSSGNPVRGSLRELVVTAAEGRDEGDAFLLCVLRVLPIPEEPSGSPRGLALASSLSMSATPPRMVARPFSFEAEGTLVGGQPVEVAILPASVRLITEATGSVALVSDTLPPTVLLGSWYSSRFEVHRWRVALHVAGSDDDAEITLEAALDLARVVIDTGQADAFVNSVLPSEPPAVDVVTSLVWSSKRGLFFRGGSLELALPLNRAVGPIELTTLILQLEAGDKGVRLGAGLGARAQLGPLAATVDRVGLAVSLVPVADNAPAGTASSADLQFGFLPPRGVGLKIDAGAITGGGYLSHNESNAEYVGALRLQFEQIQLSAIGILTTRLPGGEPGFSLLIIVSAAGFAPIQLGFGFTLTGVGGLLGVNRSVNVDVLRAGIRNRTLDAILFSKEDPVARAPAIVGTLRNVFPPTPDSHAFGPMARIEWGSPTRIVTLELALILQLPAPLRLIILGRLRVAHPEVDPADPEKKPVVAINLDALGVVDFDRREAALDAALYDSKLMGFALTGEMALRASWGANPGFALALGGFHPRYAAPVGFPRLERVALTLASLDSPRLRLESYLALTSNTVQFGSRVDFYVKVAEFSLDGKLGFDALICLDPFEFEADIAGSLTLKHEQSVLMAVAIAMTLSGPTPWHARGRATFEILGFRQAVAFDHKFGEELPPSPSEPIRVLGELTAALESPEAWSAQLPTDGQLVTLAGPSSDGGVLVHPLGVLKLSQRIVPLEVRISRFGTRAVAGPTKFTIERVRVGAENLTIAKVSDYFAPAQFLEMSDDQKLASPSYEPMVAGVRVTPGGSTRGEVKKAPICYETTIIGPEGTPIPSDGARPSEPLPAGLLAPLAATGPAALAETRVTGRAKYSGDDLEVTVAETEHVVAGDDLHTLADVEATGGTYLGADEALRAYLDEHPDKRGRVRVVAKREVLA
jgi:hypothetical protein